MGRYATDGSSHLDLVDRLGRDGAMDEALRLLAEHDLGGKRRFMQLHRDVDRVSRREGLPGRRVSGDDLAGVDRASDLNRDAMVSLEVCIEPGDRLTQLHCRTYRAQRVVLVLLRDPERGHGGIADELLHGASVPLDDRPDGVEVATHDGPHHLGIECGAQSGRVDDVGEEDRHRLAAIRLGRGCGDAGREVELLVVPQDRLLELLELGGRIDAELVDQRLACVAVGLERLCLPS